MRRQIENEMKLVVSTQHSKSQIPQKFNYTCFTWITPRGVFAHPKFNLSDLLIGGTEEGPLVAMSCIESKIENVCLLIGHYSPITDIKMSLQKTTFLSVDQYGVICGWHTSDCSCLFRTRQMFQPGIHKISIIPQHHTLIWVWTVGNGASLVDLANYSIISHLIYPGLSNFSCLCIHPQTNSIISETNEDFSSSTISLTHSNSEAQYITEKNQIVISCAGLKKFTTYFMTESGQIKERIDKEVDNCYNGFFGSFYGIIRIKHYESQHDKVREETSWSIILPRPYRSFMMGILPGNYTYVEWGSPNHICFGSEDGTFTVIEINREDDSHEFSVKQSQNFSYFSFTPFIGFSYKLGIAFPIISHKMQKVGFIPISSSIYPIMSETSQLQKIAYVPDNLYRLVLQSDGNKTVSLFDWELLPKANMKFKISSGKVTSIVCRRTIFEGKQKLQVILGSSNGNVSFFWVSSPHPFLTVPTFTNPVISFVQMHSHEKNLNEIPKALALSSYGEIAVFYGEDITLRLFGNQFPLRSVWQTDDDEILITYHSNGSYFAISLENGEIFGEYGSLPIYVGNKKPIWRPIETRPFLALATTNFVTFGGSSAFFSLLDVNEFCKDFSKDPDSCFDVVPQASAVFRLLMPTKRHSSFSSTHGKMISRSKSHDSLSSSHSSSNLILKASKTYIEEETEFEPVFDIDPSLDTAISFSKEDGKEIDVDSNSNQNPKFSDQNLKNSKSYIHPISFSPFHTMNSTSNLESNVFENINDDSDSDNQISSDSQSNLSQLTNEIQMKYHADEIGMKKSNSNPEIDNTEFVLPKTHSKTDLLEEVNNEIDMLNPDVLGNLSFVLLGAKTLPTFYFPKFNLIGEVLYSGSPYIAATHFLSNTMIRKQLSASKNFKLTGETLHKVPIFLPILTQLLFTNNSQIKRICIETCSTVIPFLNYASCLYLWNNYISFFPSEQELAPYDKILLALVAVSNPSFVKDNYIPVIMKYIITLLHTSTLLWSLAATILLDGFDVFSNFLVYTYDNNFHSFHNFSLSKSKKDSLNLQGKMAPQLMTLLLKELLLHKKINTLYDLFAIVAGAHISSFETAVISALNELPKDDTYKVFSLISSVSYGNPKEWGSSCTLILAHLINSSNFSEKAINELKVHAAKFPNVGISFKGLLVIGTPDGVIHIFRNYKEVVQKKIFNSPIVMISIGPSDKHIVVISRLEIQCVVLKLSSKIFNKDIVTISKTIEMDHRLLNHPFIIQWESEHHFNFLQ